MPYIEEQTRIERPMAGETFEIESPFMENTFMAVMPDTDETTIDFVNPAGPTLAEEQSVENGTQAIVTRITFGPAS